MDGLPKHLDPTAPLRPEMQEAIDIGKTFFKKGKLAGLRLAAEELRKWAKAQELLAAVALEEAADSLTQIADQLEEEG